MSVGVRADLMGIFFCNIVYSLHTSLEI